MTLWLIIIQAIRSRRSLKDIAVNLNSILDPQFKCHIMVVGSLNYVFLSEICINSFLKFNPESIFIIHTENSLKRLLDLRFARLIRSGIVVIEVDIESAAQWQHSKLQLILEMNGSSDIFMDADLRWNGRLIQSDNITFFLKEFLLLENPIFVAAFPELLGSSDYYMYNLSYFTFSKIKLPLQEIQSIRVNQERIAKLQPENLQIKEILAVQRMSEQLAMSIGLSKSGHSIQTLKSSDARNDGSFVESCYFGATGLTF